MPKKKPIVKNAFLIPTSEHPAAEGARKVQPGKPSDSKDSFASKIASQRPDSGNTTRGPANVVLSPDTLGPKGLTGIKKARKKSDRPRNWEEKNQYGKGFSFRGLRPDLDRWVVAVATKQGRRVGDIASIAVQYAFSLVEDRKLPIRSRPTPNGLTLFPNGGYDDFDASAFTKKSAKGKELIWQYKTTTWTNFDQRLKDRIVNFCKDLYTRGEFVTLLLLRAREDYEAGLLIFPPEEEKSF